MIPSQNNPPRQRLKNLCENNKRVWMGIINLSPNSFSHAKTAKDFKNLNSLTDVLRQTESFIKNGAQILDIGAVPSNPSIQNTLVEPSKELADLHSVLCAIKKEFGTTALISVDTYSPTVAYGLAQENLIDIVNDIYGGRKFEHIGIDNSFKDIAKTKDSFERGNSPHNSSNYDNKHEINILDVVAKFSLGYVLMHMSGELDSLPDKTEQPDISTYLTNMLSFFDERKHALTQKGIDFCVFDPGIGGGRFGKNLDLNLAILSKEFLNKLKKFGFPILIGLSRKGFLGELYPECTTPLSRDTISKEWEKRCFQNGVSIMRTHIL